MRINYLKTKLKLSKLGNNRTNSIKSQFIEKDKKRTRNNLIKKLNNGEYTNTK